MDPIHKKVLAKKTSVIMERVSNPVVLSGYLSTLFNNSDKEEIAASCNRLGATMGTQTFLSLLEKRGKNAYALFIEVLKKPEIKQEELAIELENEERRLRGQAEIPMLRAKSFPPFTGEPDDQDQDIPANSPPPPYSAPAGGNTENVYFNSLTSQEPQSPINKQPAAAMNSNQTHQELHSPSVVITPDSLVKDIPYSLRLKIEKMMNPENASNHDWRGLACAMEMSADEVRQLQGDTKGKMTGLFERMIHTKKTINDLLVLLKHNDVQRLDVMDEIREACKLPKELVIESESSECQQSDSKDVVSSVEESSDHKTKSKPLQYPRQESQDPKEVDRKPDARIPSQVEDDDNPKGQGRSELDTKPDARVPSQVEDKEDHDLKSKPGCQLSRQVEDGRYMTSNDNDDEDDVFGCTAEDNDVEKYALLLSCCGNSKSEKQHDSELRNLEGELEDLGWEVSRKPRCKMSNLGQTVQSFLTNLKKPRIISFVYLVGPTVHINGENYLLPADLKNPSSRTDVIHSSLNINWLVKQLSKNDMQIVIVDGAHENGVTGVNFNGVLQGLAPMCPPPNAVIAFPCHPGTIRKEQRRLDYIQSVVRNVQEENVMLEELFDNIRRDLSQKEQTEACTLPLEFSLNSSLPLLCLNPGDSEGPQAPSLSNLTQHAIIVSNSKYYGQETKQCIKDREALRMALLKAGWHCEEICDKSAKEIMDKLREALNRLGDKKRMVMVYFMGHTKMILDRNYFYGKDVTDPTPASVPLQWALDLMCERLRGPKILLVDDLNTCTTGLAFMTAPLDVMISVPKGGDSGQSDSDGTSFTSKFAHYLQTKWGQLSLKAMVNKAAFFDRHWLSSNFIRS